VARAGQPLADSCARIGRMIRIAITPAAFDAIAATLPFGSVGYENGGAGESYSDVILRLAKRERP
jgi:hypothetical protein